jgi:hypothetical protein
MIAPIVPLPALVLRLRLWLASRGPVASGAAVLCVAAVLTLAWLLPERALQRQRSTVALGLAKLPQPAAIAPLATANSDSNATANANLALFYDMLGERRYAEQQVKTLFALAAKNGLSLSQGEYKSAYDRNARLTTYQVNLPVKGSYGAIWTFALGTLRTIPFASLDDIGFRRDSIGDPTVEARLRLTLYLKDAPGGAP